MGKIEKFMSNDLDTSLNFYLRNGFQPHPLYYDCSLIEDPYAIGEKRPYLGVFFMVVGVLVLTVYLPCLFAIARSDLMKSSCYKIMLYLGLMDISCLTVNSVITGFLGFVGATFCSYPRFIFFSGAIGCGCWMGSCSACILLAINRCSDINHNLPFRNIFIGRNVYFTMLVPIFYTVYAVFFTKPLLFNSKYMSWFFNPFLGLDSELYVNLPHAINNCCVSICATCFYGYLTVLIYWKGRHAQSEAISKTQKQIFIQSVLICSCNAVAAYIYVYMQFFYSPPAVILIGQVAWQWAHASVCVVYITFNKSVRRRVIKLMVPQKLRGVSTTVTTTRPVLSLVGTEVLKIATTNSNGSLF
ncbi:unnamed protein product [Caenorhabditis sp. 36 PRJEB53466]|nr:unnamed protein product [Caenorhabditis sp. 36 PRJEB53466]